jgi:hypothetical protein
MAEATSDGTYELARRKLSRWGVTGSGAQRPFLYSDGKSGSGEPEDPELPSWEVEPEPASAGESIADSAALPSSDAIVKVFLDLVWSSPASAPVRPTSVSAAEAAARYNRIFSVKIALVGYLERQFGMAFRSFVTDGHLAGVHDEFERLVQEFGRETLFLPPAPQSTVEDEPLHILFNVTLLRWLTSETGRPADIHASYVNVARRLFEEMREGRAVAGGASGVVSKEVHLFENPMSAHARLADDIPGVDAVRGRIDTVGLLGGPSSSRSRPFYRSVPSPAAVHLRVAGFSPSSEVPRMIAAPLSATQAVVASGLTLISPQTGVRSPVSNVVPMAGYRIFTGAPAFAGAIN